MKFSVIIPAFNAELYIEECIQSVLDNACHDIEIIIINDGSTDRTGDIINSFKDDFIHKIHTKNKGQSAARNTGINKATGDYILFLDSDDKLNKKPYIGCWRSYLKVRQTLFYSSQTFSLMMNC